MTGAIQSTRYQVIYHGCLYNSLYSRYSSFTVQSEAPAVGTTNLLGPPWARLAQPSTSGRGIVLGGNVTLQFHPKRLGASDCRPSQSNYLTLTYQNLPTETITVSTWGVNVTP